MNFYCQLDYEHIPYPSPSSPYGNLANNGCGVCCASMVVEVLTGEDFPPEQSAVLAKSCGAREGFGPGQRGLRLGSAVGAGPLRYPRPCRKSPAGGV